MCDEANSLNPSVLFVAGVLGVVLAMDIRHAHLAQLLKVSNVKQHHFRCENFLPLLFLPLRLLGPHIMI